MKKLIIILALLFCFGSAKLEAQFVTNLVMNATPPSTLTDWAGRREILGFLVVAQGGSNPRPVFIKTEIKLTDGTVVATTDLTRAPQYTFRAGNTPLTAAEVMPLEIMIFNGKYKSALDRTGKLLSENYQMCVQLIEPATLAPVSELKCRNFFIASLQLPILMKPYNEEALTAIAAQTAITFRWTPLVPRPATPARYRIQVFEVMEFQNPVQAMRSNQPLLEAEIIGQTQYIWQPRGIINCCPQGDLDGDGNDEQINNGDDTLSTKAGVSTSRSNVRTKKGTQNNVGGNNDTLSMNAGVSTSRSNVRTKQKAQYKPLRFVWTVQTYGANGELLNDGNINGDARSEPSVFFVKKEN